MLKKLVSASLILILSNSVFAGGDDDFDFNPAPLSSSIEGTWISENSEIDRPIVFKFCRMKTGGVQVSRADSIFPQSRLQYIYTMHPGPESYSVNRFVCDRQFGGYAKLKVSTYFRKGRSGEVVLGMTVFSSDIFKPRILMQTVMRKIENVGRPHHCEEFDGVSDSVAINNQGAPCLTPIAY